MRRLAVLLLLAVPTVLVVLYGVGWEPGDDRIYSMLREFEGRDPASLTPAEQSLLDSILAQVGVLEPVPPNGLLERFPVLSKASLRAVPVTGWMRVPLRVEDWSEDAVAVISEPGFFAIPGNPKFGLHLADRRGRVTSTAPIMAGWRAYDVEIQREPELPIGVPGYRVDALGHSRQFYALGRRGFVLVRIETEDDGDLVKNEYGAPNWTVGPEVPERTSDDWLALLSSDDSVEILEALVWLGGVHLETERPEPDTWHEDVETARLWRILVESEDVKARFRELAESEQPWIAEAAAAALEIETYPRRWR